jgi:hypothetical protein
MGWEKVLLDYISKTHLKIKMPAVSKGYQRSRVRDEKA